MFFFILCLGTNASTHTCVYLCRSDALPLALVRSVLGLFCYTHCDYNSTTPSIYIYMRARALASPPFTITSPCCKGLLGLAGLLHTAYHSGLPLWLPLRELPCALRIDMLIVSILRLISLFSTSCFCVDSCCLYIAYTMAKLFSFCSFAYAF